MPDVYEEDGSVIVNLSDSRTQKVLKRRADLTEYENIDLASGFPAHLIWVTRDKRRIAIPNMEDSHLLNTIAWMERQVDRWKRQTACNALMRYSGQLMMFDWDPLDEVIESQAEEFARQCNKLKAMPKAEYLNKYVPIYQYMLQEAYKRKLIRTAPEENTPDSSWDGVDKWTSGS